MSLHRCRIVGEGSVLCDTHLYSTSKMIDDWYFSTVPLDGTVRIYTISPSLEGDVCDHCEDDRLQKEFSK